jgi:opacity protein-like surface antigen
MMEKDFENIGKRLYDQEANPPKNGFSKIRTSLEPSGNSIKTVLLKNWWKPLVFLIPVAAYIALNNIVSTQTQVSDSLINSENTESLKSKESEYSANAPFNTDPVKLLKEPISDKRLVNDNLSEQAKTTTAKVIQLKVVFESHEDRPSRDKPNNILEKGKQIPSELNTLPENAKPVLQHDETPEDKSRLLSAESNAEPRVEGIPLDSLHKPDLTKADTLHQNMLKEKERNQNSETKQQAWRLSVSFAPQFHTRNIKPNVDDEVYIDNAKNTIHMENIGFSASAGIGKSITSNFYLDATFSYTQVQQTTNLSYTNGKVDTLMVVMRTDQTILLKPVYKFTDREISKTFSYAGLNLTGTFYFWERTRSRFNFAASAGAHYLVSAHIKEKVNGQWNEQPNEDINKVNYTLSVGAGYSMLLNKGWELQFNPTLTYFLKSVSHQELPYTSDHQTIGLQIMMLKKLGIQ